MSDCLIIGGGAIGLSIAYQLAGAGMSVRLIDRAAPGREASWAGAGIIPPGPRRAEATSLDRLAALAEQLHAQWAGQLLDETGVDNGYRRCGGIYLVGHDAPVAADWQELGMRAEALSAAALAEREPQLAPQHRAWLLPDEAQIRNPRHLRALLLACARRGVEIVAGAEADEFMTRGDRVLGVRTVRGRFMADAVCLAGGAWSGGLAAGLGVALPIVPIRGQMLLFDCGAPLLTSVINDGPRYLVPRPDGRLLAGSTQEQAGFDKRTTAEGIAGLLALATSLVPALNEAVLEQTWAGLRPATTDGAPYLGRLPNWENAYVATGHFRSGLTLSPATAVVMSELIRGELPSIDLAPLAVDRHAAEKETQEAR